MRAGFVIGLGCLVLVPGGRYIPFFSSKSSEVPVASFSLDRYPVTRGEFAHFLRENPKWRKSRITRLFADARYLADWQSDLVFTQDARAPVTNVSWFAANAYCRSQGEELPTTDQWEYAAADAGRGKAETEAAILAWYGKPNPRRLPRVGQSPKNGFGLYDLHGLVWEWTLDFNGATEGDENLFCGNGSQGARDAADYASFMRYSFRSSLKADYAVADLGFRCAKEVKP